MESNNLVDIPEYEGIYKFDLVLNQVYNIKRNKYKKNTVDTNGYHCITLHKNTKRQKKYLHRLIYQFNNPTEDIILFDIDHIDNNRTNNKIENLRKATRSENCYNKKAYINNKSTGYKNISMTISNTYQFQLRKNKINYCKCFKNLQDAIEYRDIKVKEICGEFSNLG